MINLTPINKKIQKRLFEKMDVLGRKTFTAPNQPAKGGGSLTHAKMATRSTFLRMTSGQLNPVILMGGKLKDGGSMYSGYDDIYGSRTYKTGGTQHTLKELPAEKQFEDDFGRGKRTTGNQGVAAKTRTLENKFKRPIPGVKGVDVTFKGGVRALREATITWTCWSFEELDLLMPHFLSHGKQVMIEWGWVYDKDTLKKLPDFLKTDSFGNKYLSADVYKDYREQIFDADGDFDMMVGIIKNFEFTTRDDGAFDCQTILTSVGASILSNPQPNEAAVDPSITYNLSANEDTKETAAKIKRATGDTGTDLDEGGNKNSLINLNTSVSLKLFIKEINRYILENSLSNGKIESPMTYNSNKYLATFKGVRTNLNTYMGKNWFGNTKALKPLLAHTAAKFWVRWGWFEDKVLSKFLSLTSNVSSKDESYDPVITEFRSIERNLDKNSNDSSDYESTRIKNSNQLETTNINHYILPGQFNPQTPRSFEIDGKEETLPGDDEFLHKLKKITEENFSPFVCPFVAGKKVEVNTPSPQRKKTNKLMKKRGIKIRKKQLGFTAQQEEEFQKSKAAEKQFTPGKVPTEQTYEHGYLRNMLINTDLIKQAFGVSETDEFTVESINVLESMESLFSLLNQELNFWNYKITTDEVETNRAKIIDDQVTNFNFDRETTAQRSFVQNGEVTSTDSGEEGIFFFPVWNSDTIVKRQNITAKIPDEMQLSIMYGSNMDQIKDFANPGGQFAEKEGVLAGGLFNSSQDSSLGGLDIAIRNENTNKIGVPHGKDDDGGFIEDASIPLTSRGGNEDNIVQFLKDNSTVLEEKFEERLTKINNTLKLSAKSQEALSASFDNSIPPPFASNLSDKDLADILEKEKDGEILGFNKGKLTELLGSVFEESGEMKAQFKKSISYLTTQHGIHKQANTPLLIPLELELDIDGIGGIYPGNSYQSTYVPTRYQTNTVFQCFDVNHRLDSSGWTVTLTGKMRATMNNIFNGFKTLEQLQGAQFTAYQKRSVFNEAKKKKEATDKLGKLTEGYQSGTF